MTLRTTVRDGLIIINTHGALPDGTPVEVVRLDRPKKKATKRAASRRKTIRLPAGFGGWRHRTDIEDTVDFARALRGRVGRRSPRD